MQRRDSVRGVASPLTVTVSEAATILGVSRSHAYALVRDGHLPALRLGRRVLVPRVALLSLIDGAAGSDD